LQVRILGYPKPTDHVRSKTRKLSYPIFIKKKLNKKIEKRRREREKEEKNFFPTKLKTGKILTRISPKMPTQALK